MVKTRFTEKEKILLYSLFVKNLHILDIKERKNTLNKHRAVRDCWNAIFRIFNEDPFTEAKTMKQLQKFWLNSKLRKQIPTTGETSYNSSVSSQDEKTFGEGMIVYDETSEQDDTEKTIPKRAFQNMIVKTSKANDKQLMKDEIENTLQAASNIVQIHKTRGPYQVKYIEIPQNTVEQYHYKLEEEHLQLSSVNTSDNEETIIADDGIKTEMEIVEDIEVEEVIEMDQEEEDAEEHSNDADVNEEVIHNDSIHSNSTNNNNNNNNDSTNNNNNNNENDIDNEELNTTISVIYANDVSIIDRDNTALENIKPHHQTIQPLTQSETILKGNITPAKTDESRPSATTQNYINIPNISTTTNNTQKSPMKRTQKTALSSSSEAIPQTTQLTHHEHMQLLERQERELRISELKLKCQLHRLEVMRSREELQNMKQLHEMKIKEMEMKLLLEKK